MRLYYYSGFGSINNFGDELNHVIWNALLPGLLDDDSDELFVGIGTLINQKLPKARKTVIMGSGVGYGNVPSKEEISKWHIYCLRGKSSADTLGVSRDLVATDPAILVHRLFPSAELKEYDFAFMPHWMNAGSAWEPICKELGIKFLNPLDKVEKLIRDIKQSNVVIAEAMHGAIVADALRIPWLPVSSTFGDFSPFKWNDWCSSLELTCTFSPIDRPWHPEHFTPALKLKDRVKAFLRPVNQRRIEKQLAKVCRSGRQCLSSDAVFAKALGKVESAVEHFRSDCRRELPVP